MPVVSRLTRFIEDLAAPSSYRDRKYEGGELGFIRDLRNSTTLYVGNLSFYTTEEQIYELFSKCGEIKRMIMGLDRFKKTPCGFCFVEYYTRNAALACKKYLDGMKLDERYIRVDLDPGFKEGRQLGRGRRGGQVRDEFRETYDAGRGGWGGSSLAALDNYREQMQQQHYEAISQIPSGDYNEKTSSRHEHGSSRQTMDAESLAISRTSSREDNLLENETERGRSQSRSHENPRFRETGSDEE